MSITLEIPTDVERTLTASWGSADGELPSRILEAVAIAGYRQGILSQREIGQLLRLDFWKTEAFLRANEVFLPYGQNDLEADRRANNLVLGQPEMQDSAA